MTDMIEKAARAELKSDPAYHDGFFDAQAGEPLFPDASAPYEAGWRAFWRARELLVEMGFSERADGTFTKHSVILTEGEKA